MKNITWRGALTIAVAAPIITVIAIATLLLKPEPTPSQEQWTQPPPAPEGDIRTDEGQATEMTIIEFGDFQCPYCARFAQQLLPALEHDVLRDGNIRFQYRHFPFLSPQSTIAAEASECARDQGLFKEYHDRVYQLTATKQGLSNDNLHQAARDSGLEMEQFTTCAQERLHQDRVQADRQYGEALGVRGTPTLAINGEIITWKNYEELVTKIREQSQNPPRTY